MTEPAIPVDASTVILVRHGQPVGTPWECYMIRRPVRSDFAADVYVFPGGKVDPEDRNPSLARHVHLDAWLDLSAEGGDEARALRVAATRELFEEVGILLAGDDHGPVRTELLETAEYETVRQDVIAGRVGFDDFLLRHNLTLELDMLHPFARWITPRELPRRYDTRFYVALLPGSQVPQPDRSEAPEGLWVSPNEALRRHDSATFPLVFATKMNLERMARYRSPEQLIASVAPVDLEPVTPQRVQRGGREMFLMPGDEGYAEPSP